MTVNLIIISYLTYIKKNICVLLINWNAINYAQISAFLFKTSVDSHESPTAFSCYNIKLKLFHEEKVVYVYSLS